MINSIAVVGGVAVLNRAAGSDLYGLSLPGKPLLYVTPLIVALGLLCWPWPVALAWGAAYAFWRVWEHGRWIDLANDPTDPHRDGMDMTWFERAITAVSFGNDYVALFWRHLTIWPGLVLVWSLGGPQWLPWSGPAVALALTISHWAGKRISHNHHPIAELFHGAIIGALIAGAAL